MEKLISSEFFIGKYLKDIPHHFKWQTTPLQIYPLSLFTDLFRLPIPFIQTDYSFLFYLKEGHIEHIIGTQKYYIESGTLILVPAGTMNSLQEVSQDMKGYFVLMKKETLSSFFDKEKLLSLYTVDPVLKLNKENNEWIYTVLKLLSTEYNAEMPNELVGNGLAQALMYKILDLSGQHKPVSRMQQVAIEFKLMVFQNFLNEKNVAFYADSLAVSENYLNRCVKKYFHKSSKEVIIETAILESQILLWNATKSVSEISYDLNFDDPSYFARLFKRVTGLTPSEYRKNINARFV
ncbi:MAG: helix-turn-helix domain-containing protein [Flavobacterium sp.]|uniref:AraC family transcriptional regulator n=1 Tax=Flavobacterium sp. TaxID=239 RepID=UPI001B1C72B0|nr:helix-turn-helix domain-containing protein [Flavobacterium sp.]MBO9584474.1 helix-turn-helix domain-containing protein [Flavobacterium sp.]